MEAFWKPEVFCLICMTQNVPGVDFIGDTLIYREDQTIAGVADINICESCMTQAARLVGMADKQTQEEWAYKQYAYEVNIEKLKDELEYYQEKAELYDRIISLRDYDAVAYELEPESDSSESAQKPAEKRGKRTSKSAS